MGEDQSESEAIAAWNTRIIPADRKCGWCQDFPDSERCDCTPFTDARARGQAEEREDGFLQAIHDRTPTGAWIAVQHHPNGDWSVAQHPLPWLPGGEIAVPAHIGVVSARARLIASIRSGETPLPDANGWQPIETAPKDGTRILVQLRDPLPVTGRPDLDRWHGIPFVAQHMGVADDGFDIGWQFAAPVGQGGFPDEWIAGWQPLPDAPAAEVEHG